jgi:tRNA G26 N,N-dimethylase Trm1
MAKFKINSEKKDNSHPKIKIALRKKISEFFEKINILDVYGGYGLMYDKVWKNIASEYNIVEGDSIEWLKNQRNFTANIYDVDPYASPFEAIELICEKTNNEKISIICTDGYLRRCAMMRTKFNKFTQMKTGWEERNLSLMAAIYHQYPKFLRYFLSKITKDFTIEKLYIKYGIGTWKQANVYFAVILKKAE